MSIAMKLSRRKVASLALAALLAGCKVIPQAAPPAPVPTPVAPDALPLDKQRHRVALLVPLSGPNAAAGQAIANATTMALLDTNAQTLRITTYDTAANPAAAASRALSEGNSLILGPIQADEIAKVSVVARAQHVPMITYSGDAQLASDEVFVMGSGTGNAITRVVRFAHARGAARFALLAPGGDYGARVRANFAEAVREAGGGMVASESYDRSNPSIISAAQRLKAKTRFDAVLIADSGRFAALAAPRLKTPGAAVPRILGPDLWSGDSAVASSPGLRGAWFAALTDTRFRRFVESYKSRFGTAPYRVATLGYDSVLLAVRVAREWKPGAPFPVARMTDPSGFLGLDGPFRFGVNGVNERSLEVREVHAGTVSVVSPAPEKFAE